MICLTKNEHGAELLTGYLAKTLDADGMAEVEVTPGVDARLYARIAAEDAYRPWWRRLLWRPAVPLVAAGALVGLGLLMVPRTHDAAKQASTMDIEQVAQAVEDMDLLTPISQ